MSALFALAWPQAPPSAQESLVFVGTYTNAESKGIYAFRFNATTGAFRPMGLAAETSSPSFIVQSPDGRFLFAVNEVDQFSGEAAGSVSSFKIDKQNGTLTLINVQSSKGAAPCHLAVDATGKFLAVANYNGGNFAVLPIGADGSLQPAKTVLNHEGSGPNRERQSGPHAHAVVFDRTNKFLIGTDLGTDRVWIYRFDPATGAATAATPAAVVLPPGSGPRHFAFHPARPLAFVINELNSTMTTLAWSEAAGPLTVKSALSTLPAAFKGSSSTAELAVHPSGRFVYGSNRGHDSIAVFAISDDAKLTAVEQEPTQGSTPRHFTIDPSGRWLIAANQGSSTLMTFRIDQGTGALTPAGAPVPAATPVCVLFVR
jgi:6-phosphogluconolactonase